jgi:hypothetical protein
MNESNPSTEVIGNGPHISVWINSNIPELLVAPFLNVLAYFPLILSMHCLEYLFSDETYPPL